MWIGADATWRFWHDFSWSTASVDCRIILPSNDFTQANILPVGRSLSGVLSLVDSLSPHGRQTSSGEFSKAGTWQKVNNNMTVDESTAKLNLQNYSPSYHRVYLPMSRNCSRAKFSKFALNVIVWLSKSSWAIVCSGNKLIYINPLVFVILWWLFF